MTISRSCIAWFVAAAVASACVGEESDIVGNDSRPSFEEFRAQSEQLVDGTSHV